MLIFPSLGSLAERAWRHRRVCSLRAAAFVAALCTGLPVTLAQSSRGDSRRPGEGDRRGEGDGRRGGSPQEMQSRYLSSLRDRFDVTDDEEWGVISERILKVFELRRADGGGFRGGPPGGGAAAMAAAKSRGFRPGGGSPEVQALQAAVVDKMPEAEIKLRLARLREVRQSNESRLHKAQEDLRAVLTVRQEAIAVLLGLLP